MPGTAGSRAARSRRSPSRWRPPCCAPARSAGDHAPRRGARGASSPRPRPALAIGIEWWALVVATLPLLALAAHLLAGSRPVLADVPSFLLGQAFQLVTAVLIINLAEELAWAGFLQTRLEQRHGLPVAAGLTALPFALLHLPLLPLASGPLWRTAAITIVFALAVRLALGVAMRGTGASVLAVAVLHAEINKSTPRRPPSG
ncbi:CPBP family glutamic-type intramembrane protease [Pseudonocardia halophobica]|uniref:CPBP family glutamic-type intramembrane protease n=1 Tax=Pseudonocardia halophobica TaxID=29401 RepID=UPI003D8B1A30